MPNQSAIPFQNAITGHILTQSLARHAATASRPAPTTSRGGATPLTALNAPTRSASPHWQLLPLVALFLVHPILGCQLLTATAILALTTKR